ncbi:septum formation initiator family protein [Allorhizobium sp. BGMRC 0089]|uniref:FtsB family cell division protein n=1 Tax=Allorhizobium sonneratiae TaxID=2934936 RepID=UPI002033EA16|nr:septum formation initiator family protein [Allorhizobium sonneratiae]MCM2292847.1 septum formation initiator family protein [Allorhizobium sonneratiae]
MWTRHHKNRKLGRFVLPAVTVAFVSYFGYHCVHGEYGLEAAKKFDALRIVRNDELAALVKKRKRLETAVKMLSDGSLDKDMVDEKARFQLNMSRPDEIVIFNR